MLEKLFEIQKMLLDQFVSDHVYAHFVPQLIEATVGKVRETCAINHFQADGILMGAGRRIPLCLLGLLY